MNIALLGYGKMGKEIEKIALERNHTISLKIDLNNQADLTDKNLKKSDVAIDFSVPDSAYQNIVTCLKAGTPIVSGTTGWLDQLNNVTKLCNDTNGSFFYASNYSLGVNIFFNINRQLAKIMNRFNDYDVTLDETHHTQKLDAPSGTALTLAEDLLKEISRKKGWTLDESQATEQDKLTIKAHRIEAVPGIHEITYDSEVDYITIKHSAKSRKGFAFGAVLAAEFIHNKKGIFGMNDLLGL